MGRVEYIYAVSARGLHTISEAPDDPHSYLILRFLLQDPSPQTQPNLLSNPLKPSQTSPPNTPKMTQELDILILGAGWTGTFLIPLLHRQNLLFAATTSNGRPVAGHPTLKFHFDPLSPSLPDTLRALPRARTVLIVFPLKGPGASKALVEAYRATHGYDDASPPSAGPRFVQLGSTGIWKEDPVQRPWLDRGSPYDAVGDARAVAEDELRGLGGCVLNLAGLWGGERDPRHWVGRVAATKEAVRGKGSLHMVHGVDVARVVVALVEKGKGEGWERVGRGQRWMVTDGFVYDWWSLFAGWADSAGGEEPIDQAKWVFEIMREEGVRALPRSMEALGRCYDSRELWTMLGIAPLKGGLGLL